MSDGQDVVDRVFHVLVRERKDGSKDIRVDLPQVGNISNDGSQTSIRSVEKRFQKLSQSWTSAAIGFFEAAPILTQIGYYVAGAELADKAVDYVQKMALSEEDVDVDGEQLRRYTLKNDELAILGKKLGKTSQVFRTAEIMKRSTLSALVSEYESLVAELLLIASELQPGAFKSADDKISFDDLEDYASIEELKRAYLVSRIEDILIANSHKQVLDLIGKKFSVNLVSNEAMIAEFLEICQRRHLLIHAGGIVNKRYLRICKEAGCKLDDLPKLGEKVAITRKYLRQATACVFQVGFFSLHILWQKLCSESRELSHSSILESSHDFLESDLTRMCGWLCDFALNSNKKPKEVHQAYFYINKAQSYLFDPDIDESEKPKLIEGVLKKKDWSIKSPIVSLALDCLRRDTSKLSDRTAAAIKDGLTYQEAYTWNIFRNVRDLPDFKCHFPQQADS